MKVIQVLPDLDGGGVERGTLEVAESLVKAGHESIVVSAGGAMVAELESQGSRHVNWNLGKKSPLTFLKLWKFRRWLEKEKPDILHVRSRMPAWVCWLAWRGMPVNNRPKLVTTVHGLYSVSGYSEIMCKGERVIAVSETVRNYIQKNYPKTDMSRVTMIHRGVDPEEFPRRENLELSWLEKWYESFPNTRDKKLLCLPGRLTRLKGHHDFIQLVASLLERGYPVHGLIVGGEDPKRRAYAQELRQQVAELGLEQSITFTGARKDIQNIYVLSTQVYSLSTKPESFGRTVLEALRTGTPVIGYNHGGVGEILASIYPQGRVPLNDAEQLLSASERQLNTPQSVPESELFGKKTMLEKTISVYQQLLEG